MNIEGDRNIIQRIQGEVRAEKVIIKEIEKKVKKEGLNKWKEKIRGKSSLRVYINKDMPRRELFYDGSWESRLLFKARSNSLEIGERKYRWTGADKECQACRQLGERIEETLEHVIIECPKYEEERGELMERIIGKIGTREWNEIRNGEEELKYILGFTMERGNLVGFTREFLGRMWKRRQQEEDEVRGVGRNRIPRFLEEHNYT